MSGGEGDQRKSVVDILQSPINVGRKNTFFSSIQDTKDQNNASEVRLTNNPGEAPGTMQLVNLKLDKLLATEEHPYKI